MAGEGEEDVVEGRDGSAEDVVEGRDGSVEAVVGGRVGRPEEVVEGRDDMAWGRPDGATGELWARRGGISSQSMGSLRCLRGQPGGVALLALNLSRTELASIALPVPAERYTLAAAGRELESTRVRLNGEELALGAGDELPSLQGSRVPPGPVELAPATIAFLAVADAGNASCR